MRPSPIVVRGAGRPPERWRRPRNRHSGLRPFWIAANVFTARLRPSPSPDLLRFDEGEGKLRFSSDYLFVWNGEGGPPTKKIERVGVAFFFTITAFSVSGRRIAAIYRRHAPLDFRRARADIATPVVFVASPLLGIVTSNLEAADRWRRFETGAYCRGSPEKSSLTVG